MRSEGKAGARLSAPERDSHRTANVQASMGIRGQTLDGYQVGYQVDMQFTCLPVGVVILVMVVMVVMAVVVLVVVVLVHIDPGES